MKNHRLEEIVARTLVWVTLLTLLSAPAAFAQQEAAEQEAGEAPLTLDLPEWDPDPEDLPPELRPLDIVRPTLPEDVAGEVAELEARIAEIEGSWLEAETREAQDAALDEAIGLAERAVALRVEHQGNSDDAVRWRDAAGEASEWHEVIAARQTVADLRLVRGLSAEDRAALASLDGTDAEFEHLFGDGKYAEAQAVTERQLAILRRVLGDAHPDTLVSINNMGVLLESQGKLGEAEPYYREALEGRRRVLGGAHPDTLTSINNMGGLLRSQGKLAEAEPYYREALEVRRRVLGEAHPDTLTSINNMGGLLESQGKLAEAEPYYREALEGRRRVLGDEHPYTLGSASNLSLLLAELGKGSEALELADEAVETGRRVLGEEQWHVGNFLGKRGRALEELGRYAEAAEAMQEGHAILVAALGDGHEQTQRIVGYIAALYDVWHEAEPGEGYDARAGEWRARLIESESTEPD